MKIERDEEEALFKELWNLISELHGIASKYPTLYRLYLRVATPERIRAIKRGINGNEGNL